MAQSEQTAETLRSKTLLTQFFADTGECCPPQSTSNPSKPNVPHPVSAPTGYEYKGKYESVGEYDKVYVTGPDEAKHALVVIYDIFGFWQGSDLLASHLLDTSPTRIYMPDVFRGKPFPKDQDGDKDELKKFFAGTAKLEHRLPEVLDFAKTLKKDHGVNRVSILGYCWGGKLAFLSLASGTPFCCGAVIHPAMIAPEDGENLTVPFGFYPSMDEPKNVVEKIQKDIEGKPFAGKSDYHLYDTVHHGWAAARADLSDPENLKQYEDVYRRTAGYFAKVKC
ncbi:hypothetical protein I302_108332 [Kwoniella bestiolae CBS 10118]|uniref:Dienelactone hydrolase domain-containing protein n=1 Tax=Kwoniella bestiolae CBS 10118 TaxID=1296100 RepID=A0A1B9FW00_9TREE|nr:hypothetical protein I302_07297 [Kwoniella bestiolae CBS 10118]OCF22947.1 hypothetical protein I302_07297 [Kwoniella bestiolae CBS 10118]